MSPLKKNTYELLPVERSAVPSDVLEIVAEHGGNIVEMKRFRARNWRKKEQTGFVFRMGRPVIIVIEEGCTVRNRRQGMVPAWGVIVTGDAEILVDGQPSFDKVVDGLFCHTVLKISSYSHNVPVRDPRETALKRN